MAGFIPFVLPEKGVSSEMLGLFLWVLMFLSLFFSFDSLTHSHTQEYLDVLWLVPWQPWQMVVHMVVQHMVCYGLTLGISLSLIAFLYGLPFAMQKGLLIGFCLTLPSVSLLGSLMTVIQMGSRGRSLLQACLLFPLALPLLLLGWGVVEGFVHAISPFSCIIGLLGLWCVQGCLTLFLGSWALKQRILA